MTGHSVLLSQSLTDRRFRFYFIMFRIAGIPLFDKVPKPYKIYSLISIVFAYLSFILLFIEIFVQREDLEYTMDTARIASSWTLCMCVHLFLRFRIRDLMKLIHLTESYDWETLPKREDTGALSITGWIDVVKSIIQKIMFISYIYFAIYAIQRSLMAGERKLIYNTWLPFDATASPAYELTLLVQLSASVTLFAPFFPFVGLYVTLVCIACSEIQKLKLTLLQITEKQPISYDELKIKAEELENGLLYSSEGIHENIITCVQHHQNFIRFVAQLEDVLHPLMGGIFLISLINLCVCSFSIVTSLGNYSQMVMGVAAYLTTLFPLAIYCWFGYELTRQAESVRDAIWGCDWVGKPIALQQSNSLIISMANKESKLTAGKFVPVTISTMVNMVNQSVSYFMFLLEVKSSLENTELPVTD